MKQDLEHKSTRQRALILQALKWVLLILSLIQYIDVGVYCMHVKCSLLTIVVYTGSFQRLYDVGYASEWEVSPILFQTWVLK